MTQHPIDLLPDAIREKDLLGARRRQLVLVTFASVTLLIVATTHFHFTLSRARAEYTTASKQADIVLETEARVTKLRSVIDELDGFIERYNRIATPLNLTDVIATVTNNVPRGMIIDRIDIDTGHRRGSSPRSRGRPDDAMRPPRILTAEIGGFAQTDLKIAEFVEALLHVQLLRRVSVDFSRTRAVRDRAAREFRLSFEVDLDQLYEVSYRSVDPPLPVTEGSRHVR